MVNVPTGGRNQKLKPSMAAIEATVASARPHHAEIPRMDSSRLSATVVLLTGNRW